MKNYGLIVSIMAMAQLGCSSLHHGITPRQHTAQVNHQERLVDRLERADLALKEARLTDAETLYRQLTEAHPRLPDVWLRLGNIYTRQGQLQAAKRVYTEGLRYRPSDARLWNNLALVQTKQAVQTLEAASQVLEASNPYLPRIRLFHASLQRAGGGPHDEGATWNEKSSGTGVDLGNTKVAGD